MSSIIHCQEKLINSTLMKTWAIFYFAAEKSQISICCLVMCWFSSLGCLTDVHHICRYLKCLLSSTFVSSKQNGEKFLTMRTISAYISYIVKVVSHTILCLLKFHITCKGLLKAAVKMFDSKHCMHYILDYS